MKRFFTMLGAALLMGSFSVQAKQQVEVTLTNLEDEVVADSYKTDVLMYEDGTITICDILNSGQPLSFKVKSNGALDISSPIFVYGTTTYLLSTEGFYMSGEVYGYDDVEGATPVNYIYINTNKARSFVDTTESGYSISLAICGFDDNNVDMNWICLNMDITTGEYDVNEAQTVKFYVQHYDEASEEYIYEQPFTSEVTINDDRSVTIRDFLNSGYPASFKFDEIEIKGYGPIEVCGNVNDDYASRGIFYLCYANANFYMTSYSYADDEDETETVLTYTYIYRDDDAVYSFIERESEDEYFVCLNVGGYISAIGAYDGDYYVMGYFTMPEVEYSGVNVVEESDADAPVEYYNLNGVKVANPSAGIYVRKQGSDVKKVVIK